LISKWKKSNLTMALVLQILN